jgi:hypothetical protein
MLGETMFSRDLISLGVACLILEVIILFVITFFMGALPLGAFSVQGVVILLDIPMFLGELSWERLWSEE